VPVAGLSMFDRVFLGLDEDGRRVEPELVYRNMLIGGEPGGGKSVALATGDRPLCRRSGVGRLRPGLHHGARQPIEPRNLNRHW
jgi:hypothetical protein